MHRADSKDFSEELGWELHLGGQVSGEQEGARWLSHIRES